MSVRVQRVWLVAACVAGLLVESARAQTCVAVGQHAQLTGHVIRKIFAGPPGYADISQGDASECVPVLRLTHSLCVTGVRGAKGQRQQWVREVQLLDTREQLHQPDGHVCKHRCVVSGELARADSGHHHLPVLMDVDQVAQPEPRHAR
jgi:hypothetical protein